MANVFVANVDAVIQDAEIGFVTIRKNVTRVVEGHPILAKYADLFEPSEVHAHFQPVRTAKAEPKVPAKAAEKPADEAPADAASDAK